MPCAQGDERIEHQSIDLEALAKRAFARAKCPLRRDADLVDAGLARRRLDTFDQLRHPRVENIRRPDEVGPKGDEQVAVVASCSAPEPASTPNAWIISANPKPL